MFVLLANNTGWDRITEILEAGDRLTVHCLVRDGRLRIARRKLARPIKFQLLRHKLGVRRRVRVRENVLAAA